MKTLLRPRQFLTLWIFAVVGTTVAQVQSHPVGIPVNQIQSLSHTSCCQQCIGHPRRFALTRARSGFVVSCWETTLFEEPKDCWRMPFFVSLPLALVRSQAWSRPCFCALRGRQGVDAIHATIASAPGWGFTDLAFNYSLCWQELT